MFLMFECSVSIVVCLTLWTAESTASLSSTTETITRGTKGPVSKEVAFSASGEDGINITTSASAKKSSAASQGSPFEDHDYVLTEIVRLVFKGDVATDDFPDVVYGLTESFLTRAARELKADDGSEWSYELSSTLQPISFENVTTYMDFRIKHTAQKAITTVFDRLDFRRFLSQNSHLVLVAECWPHRNCQNRSEIAYSQQTEVAKSLNVFTTLIVLCSLCLVILLTAVVCSYLKRMDSPKKDTDLETKDFAENSQRILVKPDSGTESPAVPAQATQTTSFYASAADEDEDVETLHSTWVIPLDEAPGREAAVLVITAEDTKL